MWKIQPNTEKLWVRGKLVLDKTGYSRLPFFFFFLLLSTLLSRYLRVSYFGVSFSAP